MEHAAEEHAGAEQPAAEQALGRLRFGWGEAYEIGHDKRGYWARRRDGLGNHLTASGPDALWRAIFANYTARAIPRDLRTGQS